MARNLVQLRSIILIDKHEYFSNILEWVNMDNQVILNTVKTGIKTQI